MASIKILLFKAKTYSSGEHPVMLRITHNRKSKYLSLGYTCKENQWNGHKFKSNYPDYKKRNLILANMETKAWKIIDHFKQMDIDFTVHQFEERFRSNHAGKQVSVHEFFKEKIQQLRDAGKVSNATVYEETFKSLRSFSKDKDLKFSHLNYAFLTKYETFLRANGGTNGGISVRMRTLRALFNDAIKKGVTKQDYYPFKDYEIKKLKSETLKKALTRDEIRQIENLELEGYPHLVHARNFFVFSYYARGMNFIDMMLLQQKDIQDGKITYFRKKTGKLFVIKILPPIEKILDYYKSLLGKTKYVFPILLRNDMTNQQISNRKKKTLKHYNKQLKEIAKLVGIEKPISSYTARHSFATNLKQAGVSVGIISESLGHSDVKVTETYLKEFEHEVLDQAVERLLD